MSAPILLLSNGGAEDAIGAALLRHLSRRRPDLRALALPLVGAGRAYAGLAERVGEPLDLPSGGFPFGSAANLRADLRAGLVRASLRQWDAARAAGRSARAVVVVGDAYALGIGALASAGRPLVHLQPLVSALYARGMTPADHLRELNALGANAFMPWELALARRARRVYTRDAATARHLRARGVEARWLGSFAMDVLPPPERDLAGGRDGRPVLALLPGSRGDARESLPVMLEAAAALPDLRPLVAWPLSWDALPALPGWTVEARDEDRLVVRRGDARAVLLRCAFAAVVRGATLALGTAGTANEQAAGLGVPVVGFPTSGPQFTPGFARRQRRLLGEALTLAAPDPAAVARAARALLADPERYARAARAGRQRVGPPGALEQIALEVAELMGEGAGA